MPLTFLSSPAPADWDARIAATPNKGNLFQTYALGQVKRLARWEPRYAVADGVAMTIHTKRAPGFGTIWYVPKGPCVGTVTELAPLVSALREAARQERVMFVRIEPEILESEATVTAIEALGQRGTVVRTTPVQPNSSTVIFDLPATGEELLAAYPSKTRNMVRRALRDGVQVERADPQDDGVYEQMYALWESLVQDQALGVRGKDYFIQSWRIMVQSGLAQVVLARVDGELVAWALVTSVGEVAAYKEGASARDRPVPGVSQLVQYEGMRWAIERGARTYDLVGTPHSSRVDDKEDLRHGLGIFKRGFNKHVTDWVGAFDIVLRPRRYALWQRIGERVVTRLQRREPGDAFW